MEIDDIKLKDIFSRAQIPTTSKKSSTVISYNLPKKSELKIKQEPNITFSNVTHSNNNNTQNATQGPIRVMKAPNKLQMMPKNKLACQINVQQRTLGGCNSETDEEDWIKANIIKVEPRSEGSIIIGGGEQGKVTDKSVKMVPVAKKRPNSTGLISVSKKMALDSDQIKVIY